MNRPSGISWDGYSKDGLTSREDNSDLVWGLWDQEKRNQDNDIMSKELPQIGQKIEGPAFRDAIHVAIAPLTAKRKLLPGTHINRDGGRDNPIGIVDPFIKTMVNEGDRFYLFLYPNTITALRHEWTHPAF